MVRSAASLAFSGRRDNQRPRLAHVALFRRWGLQQLGNDRNQECSGFTGAGLGATDGVFARESEAQHLGLNRRAIRKAEILDGVHQFRGKLEIVETGFAFLGFYDEIFKFPGDDRCFWLGLATRPGRFRGFAGRGFSGNGFDSGGGWCRRRRVFRCRYGCGPARLITVGAVAGGVRRSAGDWRELLSLAFTEHFLECFEHGHLIN